MTEETKPSVCPDCGSAVKPIVYGMVAGPGDYIIGGCMVDGTEPHFGCETCGWQGYPGGRTYQTVFYKSKIVPGTEEQNPRHYFNVKFDVVAANTEDLWEWAAGLFEARLELLHRGVPRELIEEKEREIDHWESLPFDLKEEVIAYYNPETQRVKAVAYFYAEGAIHGVVYRKPGQKEWMHFDNRADFQKTLTSFKADALESWALDFNSELAETIVLWGDSSLGNPALELLETTDSLPIRTLFENSDQFERPILWPWWFEPANAFQFG